MVNICPASLSSSRFWEPTVCTNQHCILKTIHKSWIFIEVIIFKLNTVITKSLIPSPFGYDVVYEQPTIPFFCQIRHFRKIVNAEHRIKNIYILTFTKGFFFNNHHKMLNAPVTLHLVYSANHIQISFYGSDVSI